MERTLQQVNTILNLAKLTESDIKKESHVLQFIPQILDSKQVKLLEVNKDTLEYIKSGECLFIKGGEDAHVVVCSNSKTFEFKEAETSNSLLLMPSLNHGKLIEATESRTLKKQEVFGVYHTYYEMRLTKPKLQSLRNALAKYPYKGKNSELSKDAVGLSFTELKNIIQASEEEIINRLEEIPAAKIRGKWRLLDVGFLFGWVSYLDSILREKQLSLEEVTPLNVEDWMGLYDIADVNSKCMSLFMEVDDDSLKWKSAAVSQLFALYLLPELRAFDSKDFFTAWQQSMPVGVTANEEDLNGVALVDYDSTPSLVKYLPEFELPEDINERLDILFRNRTKWTLQAITPYVQPLTDNNLNVAALLTKYARSSNINGVKYYSSKYITQTE
ncbi:sister chromatid cohesion protein DCC1-like [Daphnia pulex]|uniref:Sister chromatid cohesion protein DCC1 n=1 Tax=Daphnia pulex TaxID=6669 RepID=A0A4Y7MUD3_DAPPU|nr:sister chromatid cohesion protein DCC1-like [Daphnia pulex]SVE84383.1 EOG090X09TV [Daphnia pulex]